MSTIKTELASESADRGYLEFELDSETMEAVEKLAAEEGKSPFEMCATLLRERLSEQSTGEIDPAIKHLP